MQFVARWIMYALLGVVCLFFAGLVYAIFGGVGGFLSVALLGLLSGLIPQSENVATLFAVGGGLLGGGCGLILLARSWIAQAQQSDDPAVRGFANDLDEMRRAMRPKR